MADVCRGLRIVVGGSLQGSRHPAVKFYRFDANPEGGRKAAASGLAAKPSVLALSRRSDQASALRYRA
jgi:hypothetical protein